MLHFYPRPPRGGRRLRTSRAPGCSRYFYPRPPRGGRPPIEAMAAASGFFLSTSPAWGTTLMDRLYRPLSEISIHVPRVGDDAAPWSSTRRTGLFLSTSPAWGTTQKQCLLETNTGISIHVPRVGDDATSCAWPRPLCAFLSTSPAWGTTANVTEKGVVPVAICHKKTQVTNCALLVCAICICLCCTLAQRGHVLRCERYGVFLCAGRSHPKTICI